jgi:carbonic anhydrase
VIGARRRSRHDRIDRFISRDYPMKALLLMLLASGACVASEHSRHWSYNGDTAPAKWSSLEPDFAACSNGKTQSPIDIPHEVVHAHPGSHLEFDYHATPLRIVDNGHTIQVNYAPGSFVTVGDERYELLQFHFHHPSEERIEGQGFDLVAHLVHKDVQGRLAVVAVLLNAGDENAFLKTLWANLPKDKQHEYAPKGVTVNVADLLPKDRSYYSFTGSLTTPPCTEGVSWFVLPHPGSLSTRQLDAFAALYPMNARPVQPLNGRAISSVN